MDLEMKELYRSVQSQLDKVKYEELWAGFSRMEFAIYNKTKVFLETEEIPYDERFLGNTSIDYNGRPLAIWYVEEPSQEDTRQLAANIVHEMFHSYQFSNNETRFPNDLIGLDYPMALKNYEAKYEENKLLAEAINSTDKNKKYDILKGIISLKMSRLRRYGDTIKYEFAIETVEGSAEFCGLKAYKHISEELYEKKIEDYVGILLKDIHMIFDIRRISYYTGTLLLILLEELDIPFPSDISGNKEYIIEEIANNIGYDIIDMDSIEHVEIEKYFLEYIKEKKKKFEDFYKEVSIRHSGDFTICGYDPMNMIKQGDEVLCSHFIMLRDAVTEDKMFLKGPVMVRIKEGSINNVVEYCSGI